MKSLLCGLSRQQTNKRYKRAGSRFLHTSTRIRFAHRLVGQDYGEGGNTLHRPV